MNSIINEVNKVYKRVVLVLDPVVIKVKDQYREAKYNFHQVKSTPTLSENHVSYSPKYLSSTKPSKYQMQEMMCAITNSFTTKLNNCTQ